MEHPTQYDVIIRYLTEIQGWVPGYLLAKTELCGVWVGSRGERSARDLVGADCPKGLEGKVERSLGRDLKWSGIKVDAFGREVESKYAYYHAIKKNNNPISLFD